MITAQHLSRVYDGENRVSAVDRVSFTVGAGERVSIIGRSGSGKTTLLNLLAGLDTATSGSLTVAGHDVSRMTRRQLAQYRLRSVGVIFQSFQLIAQRTALQNVELPLILAGVPSKERQARAHQWLDSVGLSHRQHHRPSQLSGGEQQRVAIARAMIQGPPILLADEPTGNLDSGTASGVVDLLLDVCGKNSVTLILITHDRKLAHDCCPRQFQMRDGQLTEAVPA